MKKVLSVYHIILRCSVIELYEKDLSLSEPDYEDKFFRKALRHGFWMEVAPLFNYANDK